MITVTTTIKASPEKVWSFWIEPKHIVNWYHASEDWHAPFAENDLELAGKFKTTMAAKDGSFSFDFEGFYTHIEPHKLMEYTLLDGRKVSISFSQEDSEVKIVQRFDPEQENPIEMQQNGWQAILDNFKNYVEKS